MVKGKYKKAAPYEKGFEVLNLVKEGDKSFVLVKVPLENMTKLVVLKTDEERRVYQKEAQKRYRQKLASKQTK